MQLGQDGGAATASDSQNAERHSSENGVRSEAASGFDAGSIDGASLASQQAAQDRDGKSEEHGNGAPDAEERTPTRQGQNPNG